MFNLTNVLEEALDKVLAVAGHDTVQHGVLFRLGDELSQEGRGGLQRALLGEPQAEYRELKYGRVVQGGVFEQQRRPLLQRLGEQQQERFQRVC